MTIQEIQRTVRKQPFDPFVLFLTDGRSFEVRHPEHIAFSGNGRLISVWDEDAFEIIDLLLVTSVRKPEVVDATGGGDAGGTPAGSPTS